MNNCYAITGSPRKMGNTITLVNQILNQLNKNGHNTEHEFLFDLNILPCNDCRDCKTGAQVCTRNDQMQNIYSKLEQADLILVATPIYWYSPTGITKIFLDRFRPYYGNKKLNGKKIALAMAAGDGETDCDLTIEIIKRMCNALGAEFKGHLAVQAFNEGDVGLIENLETKVNSFISNLTI